MSRDALEQLLKSADASAAAAPLTDELPARVRRRWRVRQRNRFAIVAAAAVVVPLLALGMFLRPAAPPAQLVIRTSERPATRHDLARLEMQAALHDQTVTHLLAAGRSHVTPAAAVISGESPVLADVREQRDRAALVLVYEAEQAARDKRNDRALAAYRRAIELFPTSHWAAVARQRLKEMPT